MQSWLLAFIAAVINDALDLYGVGSIPLAGDVIDLLTILIIFPTVGKYDFINIAEFVPGEDPIPTFTAVVILAYLLE